MARMRLDKNGEPIEPNEATLAPVVDSPVIADSTPVNPGPDINIGGGSDVNPTPNTTSTTVTPSVNTSVTTTPAPIAGGPLQVAPSIGSAAVPPPPSTPPPPGPPPPTTGIINTAVAQTPTPTPTPTATGGLEPIDIPAAVPGNIQPITRTVGRNELVQGQLDDILNADGPLMQNARNQAMALANERGLLNSAMAGGWGQQAVLNSAMPIATQDASTESRQALTNQDAGNQFGMANLNFQNTSSLQDRQAAQQRQLSQDQFGYNSALQRMDNASRENIASMQASTQAGIAASEAASRAWAAQLSASTQLSISDRNLANQLLISDRDAALRRELNLSGLEANAMTNYTNQITGVLAGQMSTEDKTLFVNNINSIWAGSPYLPIKINTNLFPPITGGGGGGGGGGGP